MGRRAGARRRGGGYPRLGHRTALGEWAVSSGGPNDGSGRAAVVGGYSPPCSRQTDGAKRRLDALSEPFPRRKRFCAAWAWVSSVAICLEEISTFVVFFSGTRKPKRLIVPRVVGRCDCAGTEEGRHPVAARCLVTPRVPRRLPNFHRSLVWNQRPFEKPSQTTLLVRTKRTRHRQKETMRQYRVCS